MLGILIRRIAIATATLAAAACLAGCAGPRPFSVEEKLWFDRAVGYDILPVYPVPLYPPPDLGPPPYAPLSYRG